MSGTNFFKAYKDHKEIQIVRTQADFNIRSVPFLEKALDCKKETQGCIKSIVERLKREPERKAILKQLRQTLRLTEAEFDPFYAEFQKIQETTQPKRAVWSDHIIAEAQSFSTQMAAQLLSEQPERSKFEIQAEAYRKTQKQLDLESEQYKDMDQQFMYNFIQSRTSKVLNISEKEYAREHKQRRNKSVHEAKEEARLLGIKYFKLEADADIGAVFKNWRGFGKFGEILKAALAKQGVADATFQIVRKDACEWNNRRFEGYKYQIFDLLTDDPDLDAAEVKTKILEQCEKDGLTRSEKLDARIDSVIAQAGEEFKTRNQRKESRVANALSKRKEEVGASWAKPMQAPKDRARNFKAKK